MCRYSDAASHGLARGVAHCKAVNVRRIRTRSILTESLGRIQVTEARLLSQLDVVRVKVALRPAEMLRHAAQPFLQDSTRGLQLGDHMCILIVFIRAVIPASIIVSMDVEFNGFVI